MTSADSCPSEKCLTEIFWGLWYMLHAKCSENVWYLDHQPLPGGSHSQRFFSENFLLPFLHVSHELGTSLITQFCISLYHTVLPPLVLHFLSFLGDHDEVCWSHKMLQIKFLTIPLCFTHFGVSRPWMSMSPLSIFQSSGEKWSVRIVCNIGLRK